MKQRKEESVGHESKAEVLPKLSPPKAEESVTNREIAKFWRQKRIEEEDHLLAAIKAAARLRARTLTEQEYQRFEFSLMIDHTYDETEKETVKRIVGTNVYCKTVAMDKEVRVGIKDWWTKSKYAYLNEPAIDSMDSAKKRSSKYIPNCLSYKPKALYASAIGVF
ncbi:uncharacterized protein LOC109800895 [Cajanus cajan]|uniref:Uncharacterized protein n=1 Tax=Cajanus cajan TaxID=3821 RepID=A0A151THV0_CAJCA|nr:uncharacterized protein LOC109800895 [Cajanus cajan]KYP66631.1 hypothetical protein KK1_012932 [Cajanus cajan]